VSAREEPSPTTADPGALFAAYLRFYRETAIEKVGALTDDDRRTSRLPSGWTPLEMLRHLAYMERRWMLWGFLGEDVDDPWGDHAGDPADDRWVVPDDIDLRAVAAMVRATGARVDAILADHPLDEVAPPGPRFDGEPASLSWICFHVLQEYARHVGHLDVAVELAGGPTGE
jgi:uncharacterized damage-inducible protein DinB